MGFNIEEHISSLNIAIVTTGPTHSANLMQPSLLQGDPFVWHILELSITEWAFNVTAKKESRMACKVKRPLEAQFTDGYQRCRNPPRHH